jgi:hypothetical protein
MMLYAQARADRDVVASSLFDTGMSSLVSNEGRFTPRGRANSLCKRLEILICDWPRG